MSAKTISLIPRQKLFGNPTRAQCQISPDGQLLSWLAPHNDVLNIWVAPVGDLGAARPVTDDRGRGIRFSFWARNASHLLYAQDTAGNEDWHVYSVSAEGGSPVDLTPLKGIHAQVAGMSWSSPTTVMININDRDPRWHDLYKVDLVTGERELVFENDRDFGGVALDRNLNLRIGVRTLEEEGGREIYKLENGEWSPFMRITHEDDLATGIFGFDASGDGLYLRDSRGRDMAALTRMTLATGDTAIIAESDRADVSNVLQHPTTYEIEAFAVNHEMREWTALDAQVGKDLEFLKSELPGEIALQNRTKADNHWIVAAAAAERPETFHLYDRETQSLSELFDSRPELADEPLVPMHPVTISARDGLGLVSYLSLPKCSTSEGASRPESPRPMVLLVHGGPWARDGYGFNPAHQWLADRGYAVLSVNYRGSVGFGKSFLNAADLEWAGKMHDDLIDAVDWAIAEGIADPDKIAIMGGSYGGYATLVGLTFTPEKFACGVDIVGPSNLETLLETIPPYWTSFFETFARRVGDPRTEEGKALLQARSPVHKADAITKPLLIGQGANDPRVKQAESDQIVQAMTDKGLAVTYILYPDEGHGFARPENSMSFHAAAEAFLAVHLGGGAERFGDDLNGSSLEVRQGVEDIPGLSEALDAMVQKG